MPMRLSRVQYIDATSDYQVAVERCRLVWVLAVTQILQLHEACVRLRRELTSNLAAGAAILNAELLYKKGMIG